MKKNILIILILLLSVFNAGQGYALRPKAAAQRIGADVPFYVQLADSPESEGLLRYVKDAVELVSDEFYPTEIKEVYINHVFGILKILAFSIGYEPDILVFKDEPEGIKRDSNELSGRLLTQLEGRTAVLIDPLAIRQALASIEGDHREDHMQFYDDGIEFFRDFTDPDKRKEMMLSLRIALYDARVSKYESEARASIEIPERSFHFRLEALLAKLRSSRSTFELLHLRGGASGEFIDSTKRQLTLAVTILGQQIQLFPAFNRDSTYTQIISFVEDYFRWLDAIKRELPERGLRDLKRDLDDLRSETQMLAAIQAI